MALKLNTRTIATIPKRMIDLPTIERVYSGCLVNAMDFNSSTSSLFDSSMINTVIIAIFMIAVVFVLILIIVVLIRPTFPATKPSVAKPGNVGMLDLSDIRYSLATICERSPPLCDDLGNPHDDDYMLHEDDWRQVEFVAANDREYITAEVAKVSQFKIDNWVGQGWKNLFVRPDHPTDLSSLNIKLDDLKNVLSATTPNGVLVFQSFSDPQGSACAVLGGFSFRMNEGLFIYGHQLDGIISSLAMGLYVENHSEVESFSKPLQSIARLSPLLIVDWNSNALVTLSDAGEVNQWLSWLAE